MKSIVFALNFALAVSATHAQTLTRAWVQRYHGPENRDAYSRAIVLDSDNNVIVTGESRTHPITDFVTIKYSSAGVQLWSDRYDGPGNGDDRAYAMAVDSSGNVFVTGNSWNGTNYHYVTIKYSVSLPPIPLNIQILNNQLVLSWTNAAFSLQSASVITSPFTNMLGVSSPCTNVLTGDQQFFRLISN